MLQFEKYQQYAGGTLAGANYDFFGISEFLSGLVNSFLGASTNAANKEMVQATNEANLQIAQETNAANLEIAQSTNAANLQITRETNAAQRAESEKAYQRSTASNQIAELVRAGFSPQQAKLIVGGSGSAAAYPPAALTAAQMQAATMQPATMQSPQYDPTTIASGINQFGQGVDVLGSDLLREDGGSLGAIQAQTVLDDYFEHMDEIPEEAWSTPASFQSFFRSSEYQKKFPWLTPELVKKTNKLFRSVQGARSFIKQGGTIQNVYSVRNVVNKQDWEVRREIQGYFLDTLQQKFLQGQIDMQDLDRSIKEFELTLTASEVPVILQELKTRNEKATTDYRLWSNDNYKTQYIAQMLQNQKMLEALYTSQMYESQYQANIYEESANFTEGTFGVWAGIYKVFKDLGVTDKSLAGKIVANFVAISGAAISPKTRKMLAEVFGDSAVDPHYNSDGSLKPAEGSSSEDNKRNFVKGINDNMNQK